MNCVKYVLFRILCVTNYASVGDLVVQSVMQSTYTPVSVYSAGVPCSVVSVSLVEFVRVQSMT